MLVQCQSNHAGSQGTRTVGVRGGSAPATNTTGDAVRAFRGHTSPEPVGLTLHNPNTLTVEGPEIRIKPVGTRRVVAGGGTR
ncbi:hypothetical protein GCM10012275_34980 [Longimycelium tulufanense]|uniref:Uncharacterized protein n=1 Tax=Longimycelium tulufanense TaxID=907463 RepID=A0A8J3CG70_9PSEU|nr:hypothetical protein GCM10012275_34980 [Longimycelium tulufanense]